MSENVLKYHVTEAVEYIHNKEIAIPKIAIILGSGLGALAESIEQPTIIPSAEIPHYPASTVPGHAGRWILGKLNSADVLVVQGRVHYYEGYSLHEVIFPIHLMASLGIKILILTTACGGINPEFKTGDLMLITDHINLGFGNPLIGRPDQQLGPRFPDMSDAYDKELLELAESVGKDLGIPLRKGVFCWVTGPAYETAAEVRMMRILGADAASMSTVPEVIVARQRHLRVLGISLITNPGTGLSHTKLCHEEVTRVGRQMSSKLLKFLREFLGQVRKMVRV